MTVPQSKLKVDSISSIDGGEIVVSYGATIPSGAQFTVEGDVSFAGIVTATSFSGDGSDLTGVGGDNIVGLGKAISYTLVLG
jgi:hypothetical protein